MVRKEEVSVFFYSSIGTTGAYNFGFRKILIEINDLDGRKEEVHFDKITSRIQKLCYGLDMEYVDPVRL